MSVEHRAGTLLDTADKVVNKTDASQLYGGLQSGSSSHTQRVIM